MTISHTFHLKGIVQQGVFGLFDKCVRITHVANLRGFGTIFLDTPLMAGFKGDFDPISIWKVTKPFKIVRQSPKAVLSHSSSIKAFS